MSDSSPRSGEEDSHAYYHDKQNKLEHSRAPARCATCNVSRNQAYHLWKVKDCCRQVRALISHALSIGKHHPGKCITESFKASEFAECPSIEITEGKIANGKIPFFRKGGLFQRFLNLDHVCKVDV